MGAQSSPYRLGPDGGCRDNVAPRKSEKRICDPDL